MGQLECDTRREDWPFRRIVGARFNRGGDQHLRDVVLSLAQPKNALLDDGFDFDVVGADDFSSWRQWIIRI
jgi:hypothetical protein